MTTWSYWIEVDRDLLTDKRQWQYGHGFETEAAAWSTAVQAQRCAVLRYRRGRIPAAKSPGLSPKTVKRAFTECCPAP
jgi:hypothetical protein